MMISRKKKDFLFCKRILGVFACLESSHGFLSMIFGFLGKFWIDIAKKIDFFFKIKKISTKNRKIFSRTFSKISKISKFRKIGILKNQNFQLKHFENFDFSKFRFFKILEFSKFSEKFETYFSIFRCDNFLS